MSIISAVLSVTASVVLWVVTLAMCVRSLLSFLSDGEDSFLYNLCYYISEPAILPLRLLFRQLHWFEESPFDVAFFCSFVLLLLCRGLIPPVAL